MIIFNCYHFIALQNNELSLQMTDQSLSRSVDARHLKCVILSNDFWVCVCEINGLSLEAGSHQIS